ncbi:MAG: pyridoxine 5'-phosphate synthase [bacterium]|nr:pyridoxine 5'-phosphate synthase [bacterium]
MPKLCVNVDHVATIRQARRTDEPDPVAAALIAERSGAVGITVHLREDRRHIQDRDLRILRQVVRGKLNLEMAAIPEMQDIALDIGPEQATLVPERREEITTEGGLDAAGQLERLREFISPLRADGISVSLFIDPERKQVEAAREIGADYIELNTGGYAEAGSRHAAEEQLKALRAAAETAHGLGLGVHAGHGLTYLNVEPVVGLPYLEELNIGHSIVAHAVFVGFEQAVREMARLIGA